jgi:hypothetical protein
VVRWNDDAEGQARAWFNDEIHIWQGDLLGKTQDEPARARAHRNASAVDVAARCH